MKTLLLISQRQNIIDRIKSIFSKEYALFTVTFFAEVLEFLNTTPVDVVIVDSKDVFYQAVRLTKDIKDLSPTSLVICLLNAEESEKAAEDIAVFDFVSRLPLSSAELRTTVQQALETHSLTQETTLLREQLTNLRRNAIPSTQSEPASLLLERILSQFARSLSTSFDLDKMLDMFLDTVSELVRPSRISLFLYNGNFNIYQMKAYRGFSEQFAKDFKLLSSVGLPKWLLTEGRVICRREVEEKLHEPIFLRIRNDMEKLRAVASVPLCARGNLIGILNLGNQVTGIPYTNSELEMLFTLASNVAMAIQDIFSYRQLDEQKTCIENILKYMSSGLIAIDKRELITICNHRALTILNTEEPALLNKDLRNLPSPLGDMLFESMTTGRTYEKTEVELFPNRMPLEITTYQINDRDGKSIGSAMIFDDISSRKQLAEQKLLSEQLELVNGIVERIAHDIKNPLVSIQTFMQLYQERSNDPSFFAEFGSVASRDLERLNELLEQLVALVESKQYRFELIDVSVFLNECIGLLREETADKSLEIVTDLAEEVPPIKCDRENMKQALWYLMKYLTNTMGDSDTLSIISLARQESDGMNVIRITMTGKGSEISEEELDKLFDPLAVVQDADIDLGPCASQKIIEEHGGRIEAESQTAGRVRFVIDIPSEQ